MNHLNLLHKIIQNKIKKDKIQIQKCIYLIILICSVIYQKSRLLLFQKMQYQDSRDYLMIQQEPQLVNRKEGVTRRGSRGLMLKFSQQPLNQTHKQYFPESSRNHLNHSINRSSSTRKNHNYSFRHHRQTTGKQSQQSRGMTINSSRGTMKSFQSDILEREIERLNSQIEQKDRELRRGKTKVEDRIKQSEVVELYRIINYYEGKIKAMEDDLRSYEKKFEKIAEQCDQKSHHKTAVSELISMFEEMRNKNQDLLGMIDQKNYEIGSLNDKLKKVQFKYFTISQNKAIEKRKIKKSESKKDQFQVSKKNFLSSSTLRERKEQYGNVQSKINLIQSNLQFLKKQNEKLEKELEQKQQKIDFLEKQISEVKQQSKINSVTDEDNRRSLSRSNRLTKGQQRLSRTQRNQSEKSAYDKNDPLNQVVMLPRSILKEVKKNQLMESKIMSDVPVREDVLRKLKFNLLLENISHPQLIHILSEQNFQKQKLEDNPYCLSEEESDWIGKYLTIMWERIRQKQSEQNVASKVREQLRRTIPSYENTTYKKQNNYEIQITNEFMNREEEFVSMYEALQTPEEVNYKQMVEYFENWGLSAKQIDYIGKICYEKVGHTKYVDFSVIKNAFLE